MTQRPSDPNIPVLTGDRLTLRAPRDADAAARLALGRSDLILVGYGRQSRDLPPLTAEGATSWLAEQRRNHAWMIDREGCLIGTIRLHGFAAEDQRAKVAMGLLDPEALGQGYGSEALHLVLAHGFGVMGLQRISLRVLATNVRAIRCYRRAGFVEEGRERHSARTQSGWQDDLIMGLLAREWRAAA